MKPRLITLIPAFALLMSSTSLVLAQSSTPSEQDSGQPAETTETSPESGSGVNAETESDDGESETEEYAGDEEGAELGEADEDDAAHSAEEGADVDDSEADVSEEAEDAAEGVEDTAEETTEEAADAAEDTAEGADEAMDEAMEEGEAESSSVETPEDDSIDLSQLRPLEGNYEGVTLSNGMNVEDVAGAAIVNQDGDEVARVEDLLANEASEVVAVLAESGGILGIGAKQIAIPLSELSAGEDGQLVSSLTEEDIENMPEYEAPEDMN